MSTDKTNAEIISMFNEKVIETDARTKTKGILKKLITGWAIVMEKDSVSKDDYMFLCEKYNGLIREYCEAVLDTLGFTLMVNDNLGVIYIEEEDIDDVNTVNRQQFSIAESHVLYRLFQEFMLSRTSVSQSGRAVVVIEDLLHKITVIDGRKMLLEDLRKILVKLSDYNLVKMGDTAKAKFNGNTEITVLPSISCLITTKDLDAINEKINEYSKSKDESRLMTEDGFYDIALGDEDVKKEETETC